MGTIDRREFLKTAQLAAGALTCAINGSMASATERPPADTSDSVRLGSAAYTPADYPIAATPYHAVTLRDEFWKPRVATNATITIPFEVSKLSARPRGLEANALEAAILSLKTHPNAELQAHVDASVRRLSQERATGNSGFEVAVAHFQATGRRELLERSIAAADAIYADFVANDPPFSGGERDAINCLQLYRATHDRKHLDLAKHYLDIRGLENSVNRSRHNQSHKPVLEQSEAVGHAVNCVTLMVSLADVGVLTGLGEYLDASKRMWRDAVERKMYITGGVGSTGNEGFGEPYSLPNISAYAETCAVLMFITLNHKLFLATGDAQYLDVMERGMYNNAVDGVSTSGNRFFYVNRLASAGDGRDLRWERASLECCPPNLVRFLASMPQYVYAQDRQSSIYVNLYVSSQASFAVGAQRLDLAVTSGMPWSGTSTITVTAPTAVRATIKLRIPGWARNRIAPGGLYRYAKASTAPVTIAVNGATIDATPDAMGFVSIAREWNAGDAITITLPMEVRRIVADDRVRDDRRRVAIERGPLVYCAEWPDVDGGRALDLLLDANAELTAAADHPAYRGVTVIRTRASRVSNPAAPSRSVTLIPYSLWANRGAGEMSVWLSSAPYAIGDVGPAGGFIFYENPAYAKDGWRYLEAAPFDQSAGAKWGCFRRQIAGASGTAVGSGSQNTADILAACTEPGSAAQLCASASINGVSGWFLPSRDELAWMYRNLKAKGLGDFQDGGAADNFSYWASSQQTADMAAHIDFADLGRQHGDDKDFPRRVRAVRRL